MMPNFVYKKTPLWLAEINALKGLSHSLFNADHKFSLVFEDGTPDARDERPGNYDGRFFCIPVEKDGDPN